MAFIAGELAKKQRARSVGEFFEKNRHMLGFDSPTRALFTCVKEAVDNALDACEEADILPDIAVSIEKGSEDLFFITVLDNGPGVSKEQVGPVFGKLLYGSRFHSIRQSRGQQGIGISACVLYAQLSTGLPAEIKTKVGETMPAYSCKVRIDTHKNEPVISDENLSHWEQSSGTQIKLCVKGRYVRDKKQSIFEYLKETSIVNPHARISFREPDGVKTIFDRVTTRMPPKTEEIKPHPHGIEIGQLMKMLSSTESKKVLSFLVNDFSRIGYTTAKDVCSKAGLDGSENPKELSYNSINKLYEALKDTKVSAPPAECLSPITETLLKRSLKNELDAEFIAVSTREPKVYGGHPFLVEAAVAYLKSGDEPIIMRFANKVPLLYQQGGCLITSAIEGIDWRRYGLEQRGGKGLPNAPVAFLVHVASTNVPFTSETKEAIAQIAEIDEEIKNALRDCARKLQQHIKKKDKYKKQKEKEKIIREILPLMAEKCASFLDKPPLDLEPVIARIMDSVTIRSDVMYGAICRVKIAVTNYTSRAKSFTLYASIPKEAKLVSSKPECECECNATENFLAFKIPRIKSNGTFEIDYSLSGIEQGDYDEPELYFEGIDDVYGAELKEW
jgi:DNA topoisomerase-6 subunit B